MKATRIISLIITFFSLYACDAQNKEAMSTETNPLLCDPAVGACEIPGVAQGEVTQNASSQNKTITIHYFTDPICSSCWGIEPQLRKLKLEYGNQIEIIYHMGGLLRDWSYNSGGISKPSDVAHHWDEVSQYYNMPIDGDVWLEDPLHSSYPPSIAFKAAEMQDKTKALVFLRKLREMVFLHKVNITKIDALIEAAQYAQLDPVQFKNDYEGKAEKVFQEDLKYAVSQGVRGFPTLILSNKENKSTVVYGFRPYAQMEQAIQSLDPSATPMPYGKEWKSLFAIYPTLTLREYAELSGKSNEEALNELNQLTKENKLSVFTCKSGSIWEIK